LVRFGSRETTTHINFLIKPRKVRYFPGELLLTSLTSDDRYTDIPNSLEGMNMLPRTSEFFDAIKLNCAGTELS
jgi:hypothetical protein